ncbi:MAG: DUF6089 family protein [Bacteroidales bacterium]|nr:DUF6089 family protein [Bacteroidales bacterium]
MKHLYICFLAILLCCNISAQKNSIKYSCYDFGFYGKGGINVFRGDISSFDNVNGNFSFGGFWNPDVLKRSLGLQLNAGYGHLQGKSIWNTVQNEFENTFLNGNLSLAFDPFALAASPKEKYIPYPYLFGGVGLMAFRTKLTGIENISYGYDKDGKNDAMTKEVYFPLGVGICSNVWDNLSVIVEGTCNFAYSDKLDALQSKSNDKYATVSLGVVWRLGKQEKTETYKTLQDRVISLQEDVEQCEKQCQSQKQKDSMVIDSLKKELVNKKETKIENTQQTIDSEKELLYCCKYANGLLYRKPSDAVTNLLNDKVVMERVKQKYPNLIYLLQNYSSWYNEFLAIVRKANSDVRLNGEYNPVKFEAFEREIIKKMSNMSYLKRQNKNWEIFYLEEQIQIVKDRLKQRKNNLDISITFDDLLK